jgi:hypothetical protein
MKLKFKEEPKEWRKSALMSALGVAGIITILRWRRILPANAWLAILIALILIAGCAWLKPRWFRGYYRFSVRLGFYISQFIGRIVLFIVFILILTPMGWILRLAGKDALQFKRPVNVQTYWHPVKESRPLDRPF